LRKPPEHHGNNSYVFREAAARRFRKLGVKNQREGAYHYQAAASRETWPAWKDKIMSWTAPIVVEVCAGLEVTAYLTAEM